MAGQKVALIILALLAIITPAHGEDTRAGLGADVRVFDEEFFSGRLVVAHDFAGPSDSIYGLLGVKLGRSWESREIERLETLIAEHVARSHMVGKQYEKPRRIILNGER